MIGAILRAPVAALVAIYGKLGGKTIVAPGRERRSVADRISGRGR
jgi:hypothetical protein